MKHSLLVALFSAAAVAAGQAHPTVDCGNPRTVAEKMACVGVGAVETKTEAPTASPEKRYKLRLAPHEPEIELVLHLERLSDAAEWSPRRVEVFEAKATAPRETLAIEGESFVPEGLDPLRVEDLNFDGFGDLAVTVDAGASGNTSSVYWLYDPKSKRFARSEALDKLPTVLPDAEHKVLKTHWKGGYAGAVYTRGEYRWRGEKLELVREETQDVDPRVAGGEVFLRIVRAMKGGKLKQIEKKRVRYSERGEEIPAK